MLCKYKHSKMSVTSKGKVMCMHCHMLFPIDTLMHVLVKAQLLTFIQMKDKDIWKNFEDNPEAAYIRDQLGKLHVALEDLDL